MLLSGFLWVRVLLSWSAKSVSTHSSVFQLLKFSLIFLISLRFIILKKIKTICIFEDLYLKKKKSLCSHLRRVSRENKDGCVESTTFVPSHLFEMSIWLSGEDR